MAVKFLSEEWVRAVRDGLSVSDGFKEVTASQRSRIQQIVMTEEGDDIRYWIVLDEGAVDMGLGPTNDADVTIMSDYETAVALAKGELSATNAYFGGRVRITNVMSAMSLLGALSKYGEVVRSIETEY